MASVRDYLHRYWFRWDGEPPELPRGAVLGCGVTGVDRADAEKLLSAALLGGAPLPPGADVITDVDVRELDRPRLAEHGRPEHAWRLVSARVIESSLAVGLIETRQRLVLART